MTPQINAQGRVTLHIHPTVSEVTDQTKDITVAGQTQSLPLAYSTVRESDSIVSALSGQVVVIGGLMKAQQQKRDVGLPFLGPPAGNRQPFPPNPEHRPQKRTGHSAAPAGR